MPRDHRASVIRRSARRVRLALLARDLARSTSVALLVAGLATLALRAGAGLERVPLWPLAAILAVATLAGALRALTRPLRLDAVAAALDARVAGGGALMVGGDSPRARDACARAAALCVTRDRRGEAAMLLASALLAAGALLIPVSRSAEPPSLDLAAQASAMSEQADLLVEHEAIEPDAASALEDALDQLRSRGADDAWSAWESLDAAREQLDRLAHEGAETLADRASAAAAVKEAASRAADPAASPELTRDIARGLAEAASTRGAAALPESLREALSHLAGAEGDAALADALASLAEAAGRCKGGAAEGLAALAEARMISPDEARRALAEAEAARAALIDFLAACEASGRCDADALAAALAGAGGVSDGRNATRAAWDESERLEDAGGTRERLDGAADPAGSSELLASSRAEGEQDAGAASAGGGLVSTDDAELTAGSAQILPRHRDLVRRYFDRKEPGSPDAP